MAMQDYSIRCRAARNLVTSILGFGLISPIALAQDAPRKIAQEIGWTAYTVSEGNRQVCYVLGTPDKLDPKAKRKPHLMVTHRPGEKVYNVVSIDLGQDLPPDGAAEIAIGKEKFQFFTRQQTAWARDSEGDKAATSAMIKSKELSITAHPAKGPPITDVYNLAGFTQTLAAIDKSCNVRR